MHRPKGQKDTFPILKCLSSRQTNWICLVRSPGQTPLAPGTATKDQIRWNVGLPSLRLLMLHYNVPLLCNIYAIVGVTFFFIPPYHCLLCHFVAIPCMTAWLSLSYITLLPPQSPPLPPQPTANRAFRAASSHGGPTDTLPITRIRGAVGASVSAAL